MRENEPPLSTSYLAFDFFHRGFPCLKDGLDPCARPAQPPLLVSPAGKPFCHSCCQVTCQKIGTIQNSHLAQIVLEIPPPCSYGSVFLASAFVANLFPAMCLWHFQDVFVMRSYCMGRVQSEG